jgi:hypothetical protein
LTDLSGFHPHFSSHSTAYYFFQVLIFANFAVNYVFKSEKEVILLVLEMGVPGGFFVSFGINEKA